MQMSYLSLDGDVSRSVYVIGIYPQRNDRKRKHWTYSQFVEHTFLFYIARLGKKQDSVALSVIIFLKNGFWAVDFHCCGKQYRRLSGPIEQNTVICFRPHDPIFVFLHIATYVSNFLCELPLQWD